MKVYTMRISSCLFLDTQKYMKYVSKTKLNRINNYKNHSDFVASFVADIFLRYATSAFSGSNLFHEEIYYGKHGKPFMKREDINFSISHSGDYIICCVSKENIGVDIQKKVVIDKAFFDYLDEMEIEYIHKVQNSYLRNELLVKHWVLREAYLKYTGDGLYGNLNELHFDFFEKTPILYSKENNHFFFVDSFFDEQYVLGVCTDESITGIEMVHLNLEDFNRYI